VNAIRLVVSSQDIESTTVEWDIVGEGGRPYKVRVLRCESRFGPFEPVSDYFDSGKRSFLDPTPTQRLLRHFYYKLEIAYDDETIEYYPKRYGVSDERQDDKEAKMLASDSEILYRMHGQKVIYFPVRTHGQRCPHCFDRVTGKRLIKNCPSCYSTTYAGGFLTPVQINIMIENAQIASTSPDSPSTNLGVSTKTASGRFPWFVDIKENDVVVDAQNTRWRVSEPIREIAKRRCRIYQTCILAQLSFDCIEYALPVPNPVDTWQHGWRYTPEMARGITDDEPGHTPPTVQSPGTAFYGGIGTTRMGDPITIEHGGTGQITKREGFEALSPIDQLGDTIYGGAGGIDAVLPGNQSTTRKYLAQTGTGHASAAPIWTKITWSDIDNTTTPTTLVGYGITDAVTNLGGTPSAQTGTLANRPAAGTAGRLYIATDDHNIYQDTGSAWAHLGGDSDIPNPVDIAHGGTGETTKAEAFDALSPTSAIGDLIYGGIAGTGMRLPGNATIVKKFLTSAGTGAVANAPAWDIIEEEDLDGILIDGGDWL
jgi:hypothetical protein